MNIIRLQKNISSQFDKLLGDLINDCQRYFSDTANGLNVFNYASAVKRWNQKNIKNDNESILGSLRKDVNLYAIYSKSKSGKKWNLVYIGKTNGTLARSRITNHLISKNEKTGSTLEHIKSHVHSGGKIALKFIMLEPEYLRHSVEPTLIKNFRAQGYKLWNQNA